MNISLKKAIFEDCPLIHEIQVKAFAQLLQKYQDFDSSPAAESLDRIQQRFEQPFTDYYLIMVDDSVVGILRVCNFGLNCKLSPICVLPEFQGRGYAQHALALMEKLYPEAMIWRLDTILQEENLCRFYEKAGYRRSGKTEIIKDCMDLVYYEKELC